MAEKKHAKGQHQSEIDAMRAAMEALHSWPDEILLPKNAEKALKVFDKVVQNRPHDSWFPGDLLEVARYCRLLCDTEEVYGDLLIDGWISYGGRSGLTPIENPLGRVHSTLSSQLNAIARRLNLATSYTDDGKSRKTMDTRAQKELSARKARGEVVEAEDDSLI